MKILVTGGAGFIGSNLVRALCTLGHEVVVLDDLSSGEINDLDDLKGRFEFIKGSVSNFSLLEKICKGCDIIYHLAAVASVKRCNDDCLGTHLINLTGTLHVLEAARKQHVGQVVFASSSAIYGETHTLNNEAQFPHPMSTYAHQKLSSEGYCVLFSRLYGLNTVCLRFFNVYGPGQRSSSEYAAVIPKFISAFNSNGSIIIYGDGLQCRDFVYVGDVVNALLACKKKLFNGEIINVASGTSTSILSLFYTLKKIFALDIPVSFTPKVMGDIVSSCADISKAQKVISYTPSISLDVGLKNTVDWFSSRNKRNE